MKDPIKLWKDIVYRFAEQSECQSRKTGAIVIKDSRLIGEGWNSPPKQAVVEHCLRCLDKCKSGTYLEKAICVHAEANAIANCAYHGVSLKDAIIVCTHKPCGECAKLIIGAGIGKVIYFEEYESDYAEYFFVKAGITFNLSE